MKRSVWIGLTAAVVVAGGATAVFMRRGKEEQKFRTAQVDRGSITQRISATGTINALIQVPVGTQVSGVVTGLYADFNSLVKKGQVIAKIDETPWRTNLKAAEANLKTAQASLINATADYNRNKKLWAAKLVDDADLDVKTLALKAATSGVETAKAGVETAKTNLGYCTLTAPVDGVVVSRLVDVGQTVAASFSTPNVFTIAQDLSKMKVSAAIDEADIGQVRVGQAAFFTVDSYPDKQFRGLVTEVQLNPVITSNVVTYNVVMEVTNEPRVTYVPDGMPEGASGGKAGEGRGWHGRSGQGDGQARSEGRGQAQGQGGGHVHGEGRARFEAAMAPAAGAKAPRTGKLVDAGVGATLESNTARYIPVGSPVYKGNFSLFPGMTANCTIVTNRNQNTIRVPAVALRFNPNAYLKDPDKKPATSTSSQRLSTSANLSKGMVAKRDDHVWILENGKPKTLSVKVGISDGQFTEISGEGVHEGLVVLTGIDDSLKKAAAASSTGSSPLGGPGGGPRR